MEEQVMMKMIIRFDEEKLNENGYSLKKIYQYLNNNFLLWSPAISHNEWVQCAKEWL